MRNIKNKYDKNNKKQEIIFTILIKNIFTEKMLDNIT